MIDFRYHIVSIVSIFLALAVGIVLGAGPLQGEIGSTLQSEIAGLRDDKTQLNDDLDTARAELEQRDAYLGAVQERIVAGALGGRTVGVVVLPGADTAIAESVTSAVEAAGGTVASTATVSGDWTSTDEGTTEARRQAVEQAAATAGVDTSSDTLPAADVLLAALLTRSAPLGDSGPDDATAQAGLQVLADAGLVAVDAETFGRAELVVVVAGTVTDGDEETQQSVAEQWVTLATALDARSRGAVLASDTGPQAEGTSVLAALRGSSDATGAVSSVDDAADPMGVASVVFALAEQDGGEVGQYGLQPGADAAYAPVPGS